jgi:transposase
MDSTITKTVGCDLGDRSTQFCAIDAQGTVIERGSFKTTREGVRREFSKRASCRVVLEVGAHSPWVSELLSDLGHEVIVANPRRVIMIAKSRNKTDKKDAELLARLARFDPQLLSPVQHRGPQARADLARIRARAALVRARSLLINHVRGVVKSNGGRVGSCSTAAFPKRARGVLPEPIRHALEPLLANIEQLTLQIKEAATVIAEELSQRYPELRRLRQIRGVGPITSATFVLTLEDPERFRRSRHAAAFLGLTPARRQSGGIDPELHISKTGDRFLRCLLVECAQFILSSHGEDSDLRRWGLALAARGKKAAKKRAVIAVARKLAVILCSLWRSGEDYRPFHSSMPKTAAA